ncbi:PCRF domain-containing protein [Flavobacterium paronense]|nr:PCRF domain-containing protein [Flavobacterium paronense]MDN3675974.1 PCRF domain-containing protein [Flavobacterium paronense]
MAKEELSDLRKKKKFWKKELRFYYCQKTLMMTKKYIMEIRGAAGGDEAALFAGDLFNMYQKYAEAQGWKAEVLEANVTGIGGYKKLS